MTAPRGTGRRRPCEPGSVEHDAAPERPATAGELAVWVVHGLGQPRGLAVEDGEGPLGRLIRGAKPVPPVVTMTPSNPAARCGGR